MAFPLPQPLHSYAKKAAALPINGYLRRVTRPTPLPDGYKRIYCYHIRKTGGTSVHRAFLSLSGQPPEQVHKRLLRSLTYFTISGGLTFVGHNKYLLEAGHYFYGFSHHPYHTFSLPDRTYTIAILRDPVKRAISHYRMLHYLSLHEPGHPSLQKEGSWLGNGFDDFLSNIPDEHLLRQLYMFSETFNVSEAAAALNTCSHVFFTENFEQGLHHLSDDLKLDLPLLHARKSTIDVDIPQREKERLRKLLEPEYRLIDRLQAK